MKLKLALLLTAITIYSSAHTTPPVEEGKSIFQSRCAACHNIHKTLTGPALAGVDQRRSMDWIIDFVHSSQAVIKSGDEDAVAIFKQFNNIPMPDHKDLSDAQIKNVVEYIKTEASTVKVESTGEKPKPSTTTFLPITFRNYGYMVSFFSVFALLIGVVLFALKVNRYKNYYFSQKQ